MATDAECAFAEENCRAVLAMFDHQRLGPEGQHFLRGSRQVCLSAQRLGFSIVDQQYINKLSRFRSIRSRVRLIQ